MLYVIFLAQPRRALRSRHSNGLLFLVTFPWLYSAAMTQNLTESKLYCPDRRISTYQINEQEKMLVKQPVDAVLKLALQVL
jgi:hypothetical protein